MGQSDLLRNRKIQHKPKNDSSKLDDKKVNQAMLKVIEYLKVRFLLLDNFSDYDLIFEKQLKIKEMISLIQNKNLRKEFDTTFIDRAIKPDGGVIYLEDKLHI